MAKKLRKTETCFNCGHNTGDDSFCSECGQQNTDNSVSIYVLFKDFLDDYFSFDSRVFNSLIPLLFKPGFLTIQFNEGKRVKYIPPLRMYIIISLIFFLVPVAEEPEEPKEEKVEISDNSKLATDSIAESEEEEENSKGAFIGLNAARGSDAMNINSGDLDSNRFDEKFYQDSIARSVVDSSDIDKDGIWAKLVHLATMKAIGLMGSGGDKFKSDLKDNIPKMMFVLLPIFAWLILMFHYRKKVLYVNCVIFSLHFHAFVFFVLLLFNLVELTFFVDNLFDMISIALICLYLVIAMKKVFEQSYSAAILKFFGLSLVYVFTLAFSFVITVLTTLLF